MTTKEQCPKCGTYHEEDDDRLCGGCDASRADSTPDVQDARMTINKGAFVELFGDDAERAMRLAGVAALTARDSEAEVTAKAMISIADDLAEMQHGRNCGAWLAGGHPDNTTECTCGLVWRRFLKTEQAMHAAWRKRAEDAEREAEGLREDAVVGRMIRELLRLWPRPTEVYISPLRKDPRDETRPKDPDAFQVELNWGDSHTAYQSDTLAGAAKAALDAAGGAG